MEWVASTPGTAGQGVGSVTVGAATTPAFRTILMVNNADANISFVIKEIGIFFDGVTATNVPVLGELFKCTLATNSTNGAAVTPVQWKGQGNTTGAGLTPKVNAFAGFVAEPTVITRIIPLLIPPTTGLVLPFPLGDEPECIAGSGTMGIGIRIMNIQAVDVQAYIRFMQGLT